MKFKTWNVIQWTGWDHLHFARLQFLPEPGTVLSKERICVHVSECCRRSRFLIAVRPVGDWKKNANTAVDWNFFCPSYMFAVHKLQLLLIGYGLQESFPLPICFLSRKSSSYRRASLFSYIACYHVKFSKFFQIITVNM